MRARVGSWLVSVVAVCVCGAGLGQALPQAALSELVVEAPWLGDPVRESLSPVSSQQLTYGVLDAGEL